MRGSSSGHILQIDALRAVAIAIVVSNHALTGLNFPLGGFGVALFYVLSGYFATRALLGLKRQVETGELELAKAAGSFLRRRWLRVLPIFYVVLVAALLLRVPEAPRYFVWNAFLGTSFAMLQSGEWPGFFSPFWSLAVLEQMLLVWPIVILGLPRRYLMRGLLAVVILPILYRCVCASFEFPAFWWFLPPGACADQLGFGGLLAVARSESRRIPRWLGIAAGGVFAAIVAGRSFGMPLPFAPIYAPAVAALFFAWCIHCAHDPVPGWLGTCLRLPWMAAAGKASYSVFLVHGFVVLFRPLPAGASIPAIAGHACLTVCLSFVLGWCVYHLIESPLNALRSWKSDAGVGRVDTERKKPMPMRAARVGKSF